MSLIECYEHGRLITKVQADGVLIATSTGSTAYNAAAGGAMVHPNVPAMLFTPICPHSLSFRPVILPDSACIELRIPENARDSSYVSFDGKSRHELQKGDGVSIKMSEVRERATPVRDRCFAEALRLEPIRLAVVVVYCLLLCCVPLCLNTFQAFWAA